MQILWNWKWIIFTLAWDNKLSQNRFETDKNKNKNKNDNEYDEIQ